MRPSCPAPVRTAEGFEIAGCPAGCRAEVYDIEGEELIATVAAEAGLIAVSLPDPGRYLVEVSAPGAWLPAAAGIEVPA